MDVRKLLMLAWAGLVSTALNVNAARAQVGGQQSNPAPAPQTNQPTKLKEVEVIGNLNETREQIVPSLGASEYTITQDQIKDRSEEHTSELQSHSFISYA